MTKDSTCFCGKTARTHRFCMRIGLLSFCVLFHACAGSPFTKDLKAAAKRQPTFSSLQSAPDAWKNRVVILGGDIIETNNKPRETEIEVLQKPLDSAHWPEESDRSGGRFLVRCENFLDPAIYAKGREISVAGPVLGQETRTIDQLEYRYPVIGCRQLQIWPEREIANRYYGPPYYGYGPGWGPRWGYMPYGYPYW